jgi:hypothetical protein
MESDVRDAFNHEHRDWSTESLKFWPIIRNALPGSMSQ